MVDDVAVIVSGLCCCVRVRVRVCVADRGRSSRGDQLWRWIRPTRRSTLSFTAIGLRPSLRLVDKYWVLKRQLERVL